MTRLEQLKTLTLEAFREHREMQQYNHVVENVVKLGQRYGITIDRLTLNQVIWDLIVDRALTPGAQPDGSGAFWPFMRLTQFGEVLAQSASPTHYDPDGYLAHLTALAPQCDPVIQRYVLEALHCFQKNLMLAASVMLGGAAEKLVLLLLESILSAQTAQAAKDKTRQALRGHMKDRLKVVKSVVEPIVGAKRVPDLESAGFAHLLSCFEMIRSARNDAGHPTVGEVSRDSLFIAVQILPVAAKLVYRLIEWFSENQI